MEKVMLTVFKCEPFRSDYLVYLEGLSDIRTSERRRAWSLSQGWVGTLFVRVYLELTIATYDRFLEDEISPGACGHPEEDYTILSRVCN